MHAGTYSGGLEWLPEKAVVTRPNIHSIVVQSVRRLLKIDRVKTTGYRRTIPRRFGQPWCSRPSVFIKVGVPYPIGLYARRKQTHADIHLALGQTPQSAVIPHPISVQAVQHRDTAQLPRNSQCVPCVNCPAIWCFHLESIMLSDQQDKGIRNIKRSYRDLRQHIHEAHSWQYGNVCTLCEDLFCYHGGKLMLLEATEGDFAGMKIDLGASFMTLRDHIKEAHGGC